MTLSRLTDRNYKKVREKANGWSDWQSPVGEYLMVCCDCHLVHGVQFRAIKEVGSTTRGRFSADVLRHPYRVQLRARRRNGLTRNLRDRQKSIDRIRETAKRAAPSLRRLAKS